MRKVSLVILALLVALPVYAQLTAAGPDNSPKVGEVAPDLEWSHG